MTPRPGPGPNERLAFNVGGKRRDVTSAYAVEAAPIDAADPSSPAASRKASAEAPAEPRDWAFIWTLVFTAVLFLRPQDVFPPLGALHLAELSAIAGLVSLFSGRLARRQSPTRMTPEFAGVLALGAVILITAPFSIWFGGAVSLFTDQYLKVTLVYLLAVNVLTSPQRIERLTWLLVLVIGYIAFRAVLDYVRGVNLIARGTRVQGSVGGLVQNPNDLALHMVVFLPFALFMAMRPGSTLQRLIAAGAGFCMMGAIVASGSRGGFLGFAVMLVVMAAFAARQRPGFVVVGVLAVMCALPLVPGQYWRRIASITDSSKDDYQSSTARRQLVDEAIDAFIENPITGVGAGQFKDYKPERRIEAWHETHNVWLQVASEIGIFGFAVFSFLMVRAIGGVWRTRALLARVRAAAARARRRLPVSRASTVPEISEYDGILLDAHSAAMAASLAGFFICSFFSSIAYGWTFYYLLALAVAPRDILQGRIPRAVRGATAAAAGAAPRAFGLPARGVGA
jgi:O-antigen ligase